MPKLPVSLMLAVVLLSSAGCSAGADSDGPSAKADEAGAWQPEWATLEDARIRPGMRLGPVECTAAFLFVDPLSGAYYLSTADHCVFDADGGARGVGARVAVEGVGEVGTVVLDGASEASGGSVPDFALIRLDPGMNLLAHPQVYGLDGPLVRAVGPTGFRACEQVSTGEAFAWHGYSEGVDAVGEPARARQGSTSYCADGNVFGGAAAYRGDSGAAALFVETGEALGVISALSTGGGLKMTSMTAVFGKLDEAGFVSVALATVDGHYVRP